MHTGPCYSCNKEGVYAYRNQKPRTVRIFRTPRARIRFYANNVRPIMERQRWLFDPDLPPDRSDEENERNERDEDEEDQQNDNDEDDEEAEEIDPVYTDSEDTDDDVLASNWIPSL